MKPRLLDVDLRLLGPATAIGPPSAGQLGDQAVRPVAGSPPEDPETRAWRTDGPGRASGRGAQQQPWPVGATSPSAGHEPAADEVGSSRRFRDPNPVPPWPGRAPVVSHTQPVARPARPDAVKVRGVPREVKSAVARAALGRALDRLVWPGPRLRSERDCGHQQGERDVRDRGAGRNPALRSLARPYPWLALVPELGWAAPAPLGALCSARGRAGRRSCGRRGSGRRLRNGNRLGRRRGYLGGRWSALTGPLRSRRGAALSLRAVRRTRGLPRTPTATSGSCSGSGRRARPDAGLPAPPRPGGRRSPPGHWPSGWQAGRRQRPQRARGAPRSPPPAPAKGARSPVPSSPCPGRRQPPAHADPAPPARPRSRPNAGALCSAPWRPPASIAIYRLSSGRRRPGRYRRRASSAEPRPTAMPSRPAAAFLRRPCPVLGRLQTDPAATERGNRAPGGPASTPGSDPRSGPSSATGGAVVRPASGVHCRAEGRRASWWHPRNRHVPERGLLLDPRVLDDPPWPTVHLQRSSYTQQSDRQRAVVKAAGMSNRARCPSQETQSERRTRPARSSFAS